MWISGPFSFVVGFTGHSIIPSLVVPHLINFVRDVTCFDDDLWESLVKAFTHDHRVASVTDVVLIYREKGNIHSRSLVYSNPLSRPWGLNPRCANPQCFSLPGNIAFRVSKSRRGDGNHQFTSCECVACGWRSDFLERPAWVHTTPQRFYFWHDFPLSWEQKNCFTFRMKPQASSCHDGGCL